jgi:hypothetical protein
LCLRPPNSSVQSSGEKHRVINLTQPILVPKTVDPAKLALVVGHKNMTKRNRLGRNEKIVGPDRLAALFEASSKQAIGTIGRRVER